ncbi:MAG: hypothetical protein AAF557_11445 [Pseudomonadota bacterium]
MLLTVLGVLLFMGIGWFWLVLSFAEFRERTSTTNPVSHLPWYDHRFQKAFRHWFSKRWQTYVFGILLLASTAIVFSLGAPE